jgi:hypothetical protein
VLLKENNFEAIDFNSFVCDVPGIFAIDLPCRQQQDCNNTFYRGSVRSGHPASRLRREVFRRSCQDSKRG